MSVESHAVGNCEPSQFSFMPHYFDPFKPLPIETGPKSQLFHGARKNQRLRRAEIYAVIRQLLGSEGRENISVRNIAAKTGYAVQTIYNLVGNRNDALRDAILEYKFFICGMSVPEPEKPSALPNLLNGWFLAVNANPNLERQATLIYFNEPRTIYYDIRDRKVQEWRRLLIRQKEYGILKENVDVTSLAEVIVHYTCGNWLEWADHDFPLVKLRNKIGLAYTNLLKDKITPQHRDFISEWLNTSLM